MVISESPYFDEQGVHAAAGEITTNWLATLWYGIVNIGLTLLVDHQELK